MTQALTTIKDQLYHVLEEAARPQVPAELEQTLNLITGPRAVNVIQIMTVNQIVTANILHVIKQIEQIEANPVSNGAPIRAACEYCFERGMGYNAMHSAMKQAYLEYARENTRTVTEAASRLKISRNTLSKLKGEHGLKR